MFGLLWRKLRLAHHWKNTPDSKLRRGLSPNLEVNLAGFKRELGISPDLIIRGLALGPKPGTAALGTYHQELIPTSLLIILKAATEGTPFPLVVEVLMMGLVFEIIREAGVRLAIPSRSNHQYCGGFGYW